MKDKPIQLSLNNSPLITLLDYINIFNSSIEFSSLSKTDRSTNQIVSAKNNNSNQFIALLF
jgi:hypothetical protein